MQTIKLPNGTTTTKRKLLIAPFCFLNKFACYSSFVVLGVLVPEMLNFCQNRKKSHPKLHYFTI